mmetsp:Transcript_20147/g.56107  ORF Transcript_20147/g.56107 Transcript_20147/m.56107 type:complete len:231 (-) Transcript_20147:531-1223(-)
MCAAVCLVESRGLQPRATVGYRRGRHAPLPFNMFSNSRAQRVESNADAIRNLLDPSAQWLVPSMPAIEDALPSIQEINKLVLGKFSDFLNSQQGQALASQLNHEMDAGSLMIPVTILEELFRQRMRAILGSTLRSHALRYVRFFSIRAAAASVILHGLKGGLKWLARRGGPKCSRTVDFICEVVFPSSFFGPVTGILFGVLQILGFGQPTFQPLPSSESSGSGNISDDQD